MNQLLYALWRLFVICSGLVLAVFAASLLTFVIMVPGSDELAYANHPIQIIERYLLVGIAGFAVLGALAGPVVLLAIGLGEAMRWRSMLYWTVAGGICGAAGIAIQNSAHYGQQELAIVTAAGFAAGFVYWIVAGRNAGLTYTRPSLPAQRTAKPAGEPPADEPQNHP